MPLGVGVRSQQGVLAAWTTLRLDRENGIDLLARPQGPRLPLMTGLPARPPPARVASGPLAHDLGWSARRGPRRRPRVLLQLLSPLVHRGLQLLDGLLQGSYPRFERSDVDPGLWWDALPHLWR
jgi:hypothetical protein